MRNAKRYVPVISDGKIYLRSETEILLYDFVDINPIVPLDNPVISLVHGNIVIFENQFDADYLTLDNKTDENIQ